METKTGIIVIDLRNIKETDSKIGVVKAFKEAFGLTLKEAKDLADEHSGKIYTHIIEYVDRKLFKTQVELIINIFNANNIKNSVKYFYDYLDNTGGIIKYKDTSITKQTNYEEVEEGVVKVGSVYILEENKYKHYKQVKAVLKDLFGTIENFKKYLENASIS